MNDVYPINTTSGPAMVFSIPDAITSWEEKQDVFRDLEDCILNRITVILYAGNHGIWNSFASKVKELSETHDIQCLRTDKNNRSGFRLDFA